MQPQTPENPQTNNSNEPKDLGSIAAGQIITPSQTNIQASSVQPSAPLQSSSDQMSAAYPMVSSNTSGLEKNKKSKFGFKKPGKKGLAAAIVTLVLLVGGAAAYFGYYLPNKPENLWKAALTNTGKGYDKLSEYATSEKNAKGVNTKGSFKATGVLAIDGNFEGKSDDRNSTFTGSVSASGLKVGFDIRTMIPSPNTSPDIYFKLNGVQELGGLASDFGADPQVTKALNGLNNQWYFIDHTLFDQFSQGINETSQITSKDVDELLKAVGDTSKKYVFTEDTTKMAFEVRQQIGKEKQDGRNVYHYKVGVNKNNLNDYLKELCEAAKKTKLGKTFNAESVVAQSFNCNDVNKSVDKLDASQTADVWVDTKTRLIHKVRFTDKKNNKNYFDIIQNYTGDDIFPFSLAVKSEEDKAVNEVRMDMALNMKTNVFTLKGEYKSSYEGKEEAKGAFDLTVSPNNDEVKIEKPTNSKTLIQLLNDLGLGSLFDSSTDSSNDASDGTLDSSDSDFTI